MEGQLTIALIVVRPGPLRDSLHTLLTSIRQIQIVAESGDISSLLRLGARLPPAVVLLEASLAGDNLGPVVAEIKSKWSHTRTVVLVEHASQHQEAVAAGADAVLYQGFPAPRLITAIEKLLPGSSAQEATTFHLR